MINNEILSFKEELLTLLKNIIPVAFTTEQTENEILSFTQTGLIPTGWWQQIFEKDLSSDTLAEITDLMDSIHQDISEEESDHEIASLPEKHENATHLSKTTDSKEPAQKDILATSTNVPEIVTPIDLPKNSTPTAKKKKNNFYPVPRKNLAIKSVQPQATQLAEQLFSRFIGSVSSEEKKLNLIALRDIVSRQLPDHTVGHDSHTHLLTLYDDINHPVASFDAKNFEVISV